MFVVYILVPVQLFIQYYAWTRYQKNMEIFPIFFKFYDNEMKNK